MDVTSLYTNIPQDEGIELVSKKCRDYYQEQPPIPVSDLQEILILILTENSFKFHGHHYLQIHGVAMGTRTAVSFANLYMACLETELLSKCPIKPLHFKRFIDDRLFLSV